jgi:hypothetical protein
MLASGGQRPDLRTVGLVGWVVILGLALAWEGLALAFARDGWPSLSDLLRTVSRAAPGRWILLALWLWLGWHLFVRGWHPPLIHAPPSSGAGPAAGALSAGQILRQIVAPLLFVYAAFVTGLILRRERTVPGFEHGTKVRPATLARQVAVTLAGGYAAFLLLVVTYYAVVANQTPAFLRSAVSGGAFVTFAVALPGLLLLSGADALRPRRRRTTAGP